MEGWGRTGDSLSRGLAWLMKKNSAAVSMPLSVACGDNERIRWAVGDTFLLAGACALLLFLQLVLDPIAQGTAGPT